MVETIWETPIPYLAVGGPVGAVAAVCGRTTSTVDRVSLAAGVSTLAIVATVEFFSLSPLSAEQILALSFATSAGAVVGWGIAATALCYARWVGRVFSAATERLEHPLERADTISPP